MFRYTAIVDGKAYLPDFYVPSLGVYVEVKGWWRDDARQKFDAFVKLYPDIKYALVTGPALEALEKREMTLEACIIEARR